MDKVVELINLWYESGWSPDADGVFGGTFHSMSDIEQIDDNGDEYYTFNIDFGSANVSRAMVILDSKLSELKYECSLADESNIVLITEIKVG